MADQYRDFAPLSITEDILHGDTELENWLCEHPGADINRLSVGGWGHPILIWTSDGIITPAKVDIARFLLARGADVDITDTVKRTALHFAARGVGNAAPAMVSLLLSAGANVHARTKHHRTTPIASTVDGWSITAHTRLLRRLSTESLLDIFELLLHAGAQLDNVAMTESETRPKKLGILDRIKTSEGTVDGQHLFWLKSRYRLLATDAHFQEIKSISAQVLAAGSYGAYLHEQRKRVLTLRELANLGRAATRDPVLNFLVRLGDNGVVWNVLSHWPSPRC